MPFCCRGQPDATVGWDLDHTGSGDVDCWVDPGWIDPVLKPLPLPPLPPAGRTRTSLKLWCGAYWGSQSEMDVLEWWELDSEVGPVGCLVHGRVVSEVKFHWRRVECMSLTGC